MCAEPIIDGPLARGWRHHARGIGDRPLTRTSQAAPEGPGSPPNLGISYHMADALAALDDALPQHEKPR
jgi:hypothetical protein